MGDKDNSPESLKNIYLIDFGLCTDYIDKDGDHITFEKRHKFYGNVALASKHAMNFNAVSRRDDMISLTYLLIYLVQGTLSFLENTNMPKKDQFAFIANKKNKMTPVSLCSSMRGSIYLELV